MIVEDYFHLEFLILINRNICITNLVPRLSALLVASFILFLIHSIKLLIFFVLFIFFVHLLLMAIESLLVIYFF